MAKDPYRHVQAGDPLELHHESFNTMLDMAQLFRRGNHNLNSGPVRSTKSQTLILVKNTTGATRQRGEVVGLTGIVFTPAQNLEGFISQPCLKAVEPTLAHVAARHAILIENLATNALGLACVSGVVPARLAVTHEDDEFAKVEEGEYELGTTSGGTSIQILYKADAPLNGVTWGLVRVGGGGTSGITVKFTNRTTEDGVGYYDWIEVDKAPGFPVLSGGRTGTYALSTAAIELNGSNAAMELSPAMRVIIYPLVNSPVNTSDGSDSDISGSDGSGSGSTAGSVGSNGSGSDMSGSDGSDSSRAAYWFDIAVPPDPSDSNLELL